MALPNGRTSSFLERMRAPQTMGGSSWQYSAPTSEIRAGEIDPVDWAMDQMEQDRRQAEWGNGGYGGGGRGLQQVGRGMSGPGAMGQSLGPKPMNVVYDQEPEQFAAQMRLKRDQMNLEQKNVEADRTVKSAEGNDAYLQNQRKNDLANRELQLMMSDKDKLSAQFRNAMALEGAKGQNSLAERRLQNQGAYDVATEGRRVAAEGAAEVARINAEARIDAKNTPKSQSEAMDLKLRQLRITRPELAAAFKEDGTINYEADPNLLSEIERQIMPKRTGDINLSSTGGPTLPPMQPTRTGLMGAIPEVGRAPLPQTEMGRSSGNFNQPINPDISRSALAGQKSLAGGGGSPSLPITKPGATAQSNLADLQNAQKPITQTHATTGKKRISYDGGVTWQAVR